MVECVRAMEEDRVPASIIQDVLQQWKVFYTDRPRQVNLFSAMTVLDQCCEMLWLPFHALARVGPYCGAAVSKVSDLVALIESSLFIHVSRIIFTKVFVQIFQTIVKSTIGGGDIRWDLSHWIDQATPAQSTLFAVQDFNKRDSKQNAYYAQTSSSCSWDIVPHKSNKGRRDHWPTRRRQLGYRAETLPPRNFHLSKLRTSL